VAGVYGCPVFTDAEALARRPARPAERITRDAFRELCNLGLSNSFSIVRRGLWEATPFPEERCEDQKWAALHLDRGYATVRVLSARFRYRLNRDWRYYVRKHRDDLLMLYRTWPRPGGPARNCSTGRACATGSGACSSGSAWSGGTGSA